jgi:hypothetical protein
MLEVQRRAAPMASNTDLGLSARDRQYPLISNNCQIYSLISLQVEHCTYSIQVDIPLTLNRWALCPTFFPLIEHRKSPHLQRVRYEQSSQLHDQGFERELCECIYYILVLAIRSVEGSVRGFLMWSTINCSITF